MNDKTLIKKYNQNYYRINAKKILEDKKEYYKNNKSSFVLKNKKYRKLNNEKLSQYNKKYYRENFEQISLQKKKYYEKNKSYLREKALISSKTPQGIARRRKSVKKMYDTNPEYKLAMLLRSRLKMALKKGYKGGHAVRDLGCTIKELKVHLEKRFTLGMTWKNWSLKGWHIDHIKPLCTFNLSDRAQFLQACHYTNLQPMWAIENWKKKS